MKRVQIVPRPEDFPSRVRPLICAQPVYASHSSPTARVWRLGSACYLKTAAPGALATEAALTRYFCQKGLAAPVLDYWTEDRDWLLTQALPGEDCVHPDYLAQPARLCDTLASLLRQLHETDLSGCPVADRCEAYRQNTLRGHLAGRWDRELFPPEWSFSTAEAAWQAAQEGMPLLRSDTLLHGDYCLPNIILDHWRFSGFVDLDSGGVGDRHIDLFWGTWTLNYNLKTSAYCRRFLEAYGMDRVEPALLRTVAACEMFA